MKNATRNRIGRLSSRRHLVPRIFFAGMLLVCTWARGATIHVPADHVTIGEAVTAAHSRTDSSTTILIAPGVYAESGIVLDLPNLTLAGTVALARGPDGFPLDSASQTGVAKVEKNLPNGAIMFQVSAANVRITGLVLDGQNVRPQTPTQSGNVIFIDGALTSADGFSVDGDVIRAAVAGVISRMASGTIQGNRLTSNFNGSASFGGRPDLAKAVVFRDNLVIDNSNVGAAFGGGNGSRNPPKVVNGDGPGSLSVEVSGTEFRGNGTAGPNFASLGLSLLVNDDSRSDPTQAASIEAQVHDNFFIENVNWGLAVAQRIAPNVPLIGYQFEGTFERNQYCDNGLNAAMFDFRQVTTTLQVVTNPPALPHTFRYGRGSTYTVHAENDPLASIGFDLDHPAIDPDPPGGPLGNTLIFNGAIVPTEPAPVLRIPSGIPVLETPPPVITGASASPSSLWPPNHKFVSVTVSYGSADACGRPDGCTLSVSSNEGTASDWQVVDGHHVQLRADRDGNGNGRTYTITITCTDVSGEVATSQVFVVVPHDQGH